MIKMSIFKPAVYCLMSRSKRLMYIGSTGQNTRFSKHKSHYKRFLQGKQHYKFYSAFRLLECDDVEYYINSELDTYDRKELYDLEYKIIKDFKKACIYEIVNTNKS